MRVEALIWCVDYTRVKSETIDVVEPVRNIPAIGRIEGEGVDRSLTFVEVYVSQSAFLESNGGLSGTNYCDSEECTGSCETVSREHCRRERRVGVGRRKMRGAAEGFPGSLTSDYRLTVGDPFCTCVTCLVLGCSILDWWIALNEMERIEAAEIVPPRTTAYPPDYRPTLGSMGRIRLHVAGPPTNDEPVYRPRPKLPPQVSIASVMLYGSQSLRRIRCDLSKRWR